MLASQIQIPSDSGEGLAIAFANTFKALCTTHAPVALLTNNAVMQMMKAGIIQEGAPLELVGGLLIWKDRSARRKNPLTVGMEHIAVIKLMTSVIAQINSPGSHMYCQNPVALSEVDVPEPDAAIVKGLAEDYRGRHPGPGEIFCVIEISDSSLHFDRTVKLPLYAAASIPQYVFINIPDRQIEVHEGPQADGRYATQTILKAGDSLELHTGSATRFKIPVADLLPV